MSLQHLATCALLIGAAALSLPSQTITSTHAGAPGTGLGRVLLGLPDVSGDGVPDYAAGFPFASAGVGFGTGRIEILSGTDGSLILGLSGAQLGARFGEALGVGDLDGDGQFEILVGEPLHSGANGAFAGRVSAHSLPGGALLWSREGLEAGERFGTALTVFADCDGDRLDDVAVGAPLSGPSQAGAISILSSVSGQPLDRFPGVTAGERLGDVLVAAGDVDGDFLPDLAAGLPAWSGVVGPDTGLLRLYRKDGSVIATAAGGQPGQRRGEAVAAVGDVNGDGFDDLVVSAPGVATAAGVGAGRVRLLTGPALSGGWSLDGAEPGERLGREMVSLGDLDGDRIAEIAVGAPLHDGPLFDRGRAVIADAATGSVRFTLTGNTSFESFGSSFAAGLDRDHDGRPDLAIGAPGATSASGLVTLVAFDPALDIDVMTLKTDSGPIRAVGADIDGDGDEDVVVLNREASTVQVFWNGRHDDVGANVARGVFDELPALRLNLPAGAIGTSIVAGQLDADAPAEILVGCELGRLVVADGSGPVTAPVFPTTLSVDLIDQASPARSLAAIAILDEGPLARVAVAYSGSIAAPSEIVPVFGLPGSATAGPPIATGAAFASLEVADVDDDGTDDLVATDASLGATGGIQVFRGAGYAAEALIAPPSNAPFLTAVPLALDADGRFDDLGVATVGFGGSSTLVFDDFAPGVGFGSVASTPPGPVALDIAAFRAAAGNAGIAIADGQRTLSLLGDWNGSSFTTEQGWPVGDGAIAVETAQVRAPLGARSQLEPELLVVLGRENVVRVLRRKTPAAVIPVPGTGCAAGTSSPTVMTISGNPALGESFTIDLSQATPNQTTFLLLVETTLTPGTIGTLPGPCGLINFLSAPFLVIPELPPFIATDPTGSVSIPVTVPNEPAIIGVEYAAQWAVLDNGPLRTPDNLSGWTLSNAVILRLGEN